MSSKDNQNHIQSEPEKEEEEQKGTGGLLSGLLDPVGSVLQTGLRPVGVPLEHAVTKPLGNAVGGITKPALGPLAGTHEEKSEVIGGGNKDSYEHKKESIGGKVQDGENPLGLDQTGRWGFRDE